MFETYSLSKEGIAIFKEHSVAQKTYWRHYIIFYAKQSAKLSFWRMTLIEQFNIFVFGIVNFVNNAAELVNKKTKIVRDFSGKLLIKSSKYVIQESIF